MLRFWLGMALLAWAPPEWAGVGAIVALTAMEWEKKEPPEKPRRLPAQDWDWR